jgi:hypothetical protein
MRSIYERPCKEVEDFKRDMRSPEKAVQMNLLTHFVTGSWIAGAFFLVALEGGDGPTIAFHRARLVLRV